MPVERIAGNVEGHILGQDDRQVPLGDRDNAAILAMDEGDGRAPVALARDAPVAQAPDGRALAPAFGLGAADDFGLCGLNSHAVQKARIYELSGPRVGFIVYRLGFIATRGHDALDREHVFACKIKVSLVVRRARP